MRGRPGRAGVGASLLLPASLSIIRVSDRGAAWCGGAPAGALRAAPETGDPAGRHLDIAGSSMGQWQSPAWRLSGIDAACSPAIAIAALAIGVAALLVFLSTERRRRSLAIVPLDRFRSRRFVAAPSVTSVMTFGIYGVLFLLFLVWQASGRLPPYGGGPALVPMAAVLFALSNLSGRLTEQLGARVMITGGTALIGTGVIVIGCTAGTLLWFTGIGLVLTGAA